MKKDFPEMFNKKKTLKDINPAEDEENPGYWFRSNEGGSFSREEEIMEKMNEAIQKDLEMHEVCIFD